MASYRLSLTPSAEKELDALPDKLIARLFPRLEALAEIPRPHGCKKLQGGDKEYRIRVGDYLIVYTIDDRAKAIDITRIAHRREVYD